jgi:hypothetical protein
MIDIKARERWQAYLDELKGRGIPTSYSEVISTDVPDDQNAAVLWNRAVAEPWMFPKEGRVLSAKELSDLDRCGLLVPATPEFRAAILSELDANSGFIEMLRRIAACPYFAYTPKRFVQAKSLDDIIDLRPSLPGQPSTPSRETPSGTQRYKFLSKAAAILAYEGYTEKAIDLLEVCLASSRHLVESPCTLIVIISGTVTRGNLARALADVLKTADIDLPQSQSLIDQLDPIQMRDGFRQTMEVERTSNADSCGEILRVGQYPRNLLVKRPPWGEVWDRIQFAVTKLAYVNGMIEHQEKLLLFCNSLEGPTSSWREYAGNCVDEGGFGSIVEVQLSLEFRYQILRLGVACKSYRKEHGAWPDDLKALVPDYFAALPLDPFTERPFDYQIVGEAVRISGPKPDPEKDGVSFRDCCREGTEPQEFVPGPN